MLNPCAHGSGPKLHPQTRAAKPMKTRAILPLVPRASLLENDYLEKKHTHCLPWLSSFSFCVFPISGRLACRLQDDRFDPFRDEETGHACQFIDHRGDRLQVAAPLGQQQDTQ